MIWTNEIKHQSILSDILFAIKKTVHVDIAVLAVNKPGASDVSLSLSMLHGEKYDFAERTLPNSVCLGFKITDGQIFLHQERLNADEVPSLEQLFHQHSDIRIRSSASLPIEHEILGTGFLFLGSYRKELSLFTNILNAAELNAVITSSLLTCSPQIDQEKFILHSNLFYQKIFQKSITPTIIFNHDGKIITMNEAMEKFYGQKLDFPINCKNLEDLFPLPMQKKIIKYYRRYASHHVQTIETPMLCGAGEERMVELKMCVIDDASQLMIASVLDFNEMKIRYKQAKTGKDRLVMIHDLIASINSTLNKSQFAQVLFSQLKNFFDYCFIVIVLYDPDGQKMDIHYSTRAPAITIQKGTRQQLERLNELLSSCDQIEQNNDAMRTEIEAILNLPIEESYATNLLLQFKTEENIIGALLLYHEDKMNWTDCEIRILRDLANYFSDTLVRLNLIQKYQQSLTNYSLLTQMNEALYRSLDFAILPQRIVESLQHAMQAKLCKICLLKNDTRIDDPAWLDQLHPKIKHILETGELGIFQENDEREHYFEIADQTPLSLGYQSMIVMPITYAGKLSAVIFIFLDRSDHVREYEIELLMMLMHPIAIAINNARLFLKNGAPSRYGIRCCGA